MKLQVVKLSGRNNDWFVISFFFLLFFLFVLEMESLQHTASPLGMPEQKNF